MIQDLLVVAGLLIFGVLVYFMLDRAFNSFKRTGSMGKRGGHLREISRKTEENP